MCIIFLTPSVTHCASEFVVHLLCTLWTLNSWHACDHFVCVISMLLPEYGCVIGNMQIIYKTCILHSTDSVKCFSLLT